jgi:uncharacterized protein with PIN domain
MLGPEVERRFVADAMLGKLARWLRLLGFDCTYDSAIADADLVQQGITQERIILTRDRALADEWWVSGIHIVEAEKLRDQLAEVLMHFQLSEEIRLLSRCAECNHPLHRTDPALIRDRVPVRVWRTQDAFSTCPECERVYWEGSHARRIQRFVDELLARAARDAARPSSRADWSP